MKLSMLLKKKKEGKNSIFKKVFIGLVFSFIIGVVGIFVFFGYLIKDLPSMEEIQNIQTSESTKIFDRNGKLLYTIHGDENREVVPFEKITNETIYSVIALEDEDFFGHEGVDYQGVIRAILGQLHLIDFSGGGSTITQQFVKNKYLSSERSYIRKLKEMFLSLQIENSYSKKEIITMYLNQIPFGSNIYGIEQACKTFFGKDSAKISLAESAIIASIPNATTRYSPYGEHFQSKLIGIDEEKLEEKDIENYEELIENFGESIVSYGLLPKEISLYSGSTVFYLPGRSSHAINKMLELGYIKEEKAKETLAQLASYEFKPFKQEIKAPHFVMHVKKLLTEKYGEELLSIGGLKVTTTLDLDLQEKAEELVKNNALENQKSYDSENQSLLSVDVESGDVLAMVGSRDFFDKEIDGQVNVITQRRLPGSTFKPFAYLAMMMNGYSPSTIIFDTETNFGEEGKDYQPQNFDGKFLGPMTMRKALGHSRNIPAIKAGILGGLEKTYEIAKTLGLSFTNSVDWYGASLPLGTADVKGTEMMEAYLVFANLGKKVELNSILKITDKDGIILEEKKESSKDKVLDENFAYIMTHMLADPTARGAGWNSRLQLKGRENAVKTGTSNKSIEKPGSEKAEVLPLDAWTIGYTPQLATLVWSGNNDGRPMNKNASGWGTSSKTWKEFMEIAHEGLEVKRFKKPDGIMYLKVAKLSGKLPSKDTPEELTEVGIFSKLNTPVVYDNSLIKVEIDKISKKLPTSLTPEDAIGEATVLKMHSLKPRDSRWEAPAQEWLQKNAEEFLKENGINEILAEVPTEFDDIHTRENTISKPKIQITTPKDGSKVSNLGFSVLPEFDGKYSILKVEYYLDGELVDSQNSSPFLGKIEKELEVGTKHTLQAKIFDKLYNSGKSEKIEIEIGKDNEKPYTEIVRPKTNQKLISGSSYEIKTLSYDTGSEIELVEFYLDGEQIGESKESPYSLIFTVPEKEKDYQIKVIAFDRAGNQNLDTKNFEVTNKNLEVKELKIELESEGKVGMPTEIGIFIEKEKLPEIKKIELTARRTLVTGEREDLVIGEITNPGESKIGVFYLNWIPKEKDNYLIYATEYYEVKALSSQKKLIKIK